MTADTMQSDSCSPFTATQVQLQVHLPDSPKKPSESYKALIHSPNSASMVQRARSTPSSPRQQQDSPTTPTSTSVRPTSITNTKTGPVSIASPGSLASSNGRLSALQTLNSTSRSSLISIHQCSRPSPPSQLAAASGMDRAKS